MSTISYSRILFKGAGFEKLEGLLGYNMHTKNKVCMFQLAHHFEGVNSTLNIGVNSIYT